MDVVVWARDGAVVGAGLPVVAGAVPVVLASVWWDAWPPAIVWGIIGAAIGAGAVGGAGLGSGLGAGSVAWPRAGFVLGLPAGAVAGLVATAVVAGSIVAHGEHLPPLLPVACGLVAACTIVLGPAHALYLAVRRRGRSGIVVLPLVAAYAALAGPVSIAIGVVAGDRLRPLVVDLVGLL